MPIVVLDGETVDFQGEQPVSAEAVWKLLENFLGENGRVIDSFQLNGELWLMGDETVSTLYQRIEVSSLSQIEKLLDVLKGFLESKKAVLESWSFFANRVLSEDQQTMVASSAQVLEGSSNLVEFAGVTQVLGESINASWAQSTKEIATSLNAQLELWMDALESRDPIVLSDLASSRLSRLLESFFALLESEIKPDLEARI